MDDDRDDDDAYGDDGYGEDDDFDYDEFVSREFGESQTSTRLNPFHRAVVVVLIIAFAFSLLYPLLF